MPNPDPLLAYLSEANGKISYAGFQAFQRQTENAAPTRTTDAYAQHDHYTSADGSPLTVENSGNTEYARRVAAGAAQEKASKLAWQELERKRAVHRAESEAAGEHQPDEFERAQASAARMREVEAERTARDAKPALVKHTRKAAA